MCRIREKLDDHTRQAHRDVSEVSAGGNLLSRKSGGGTTSRRSGGHKAGEVCRRGRML